MPSGKLRSAVNEPFSSVVMASVKLYSIELSVEFCRFIATVLEGSNPLPVTVMILLSSVEVMVRVGVVWALTNATDATTRSILQITKTVKTFFD